MKPILPVACFVLKSAWQAVFLRSALTALLLVPLAARDAAEPARDADRYLQGVRAYADCMIKHGRDTYGKEHSPLFAEALDRRTLKVLAGEELKKAKALTFDEWLIRPGDRMLTGANPMHCQNLYQVLYALSEITGEERYATEADASLKYFFERCQHPVTGLLYWGEHAGWDLSGDTPLSTADIHEFFRPWVLWERCWELAPEACVRFARGLWDYQIGDHQTGLYSRHAYIKGDKRYPATAPYPRHGGFYVETWAIAFQHTQDKTFLKAIETMVDCQERLRTSGGMVVGGDLKSKARKAQDVSFAISLWQAAPRLPEPLAGKLRAVARANDIPATEDVSPKLKSPNIWSGGYGGAGGQIAGPAVVLLLRHQQTQPAQYRERILAVAEVHLTSPVMLGFPLHPDIFGKVIHLLLGAHELTGDPRYLAKAEELAAKAIELFLPDDCPLPKASHQHDHYEAVTRADSLMMSLLQLWAARQNPGRKLRLVYTDR